MRARTNLDKENSFPYQDSNSMRYPGRSYFKQRPVQGRLGHWVCDLSTKLRVWDPVCHHVTRDGGYRL
jgi:hypothetical protein